MKPEDEALFERGFPHLHVLADESITSKAAIKQATKALDAIDPHLPVVVSADVARRYVLGHLVGRTWGHGPGAATVALPERQSARAAAIASSTALDPSLLEQFLELNIPCGREHRTEVDGVAVAWTDNEIYGWRLQEICWIFEGVLGTEAVASRIVSHLLRALNDAESWGFWGKDPWRHNASAHQFAFAVATMRWRLRPEEWSALVAPFANVESARLLVFADLLACLADDTRAPKCPFYVNDFALRRRTTDALTMKGEARFWHSELPWLLPNRAYQGERLTLVKKLPKWKKLRFIDEVGRITTEEAQAAVAILTDKK
jgi:hypothetical protein